MSVCLSVFCACLSVSHSFGHRSCLYFILERVNTTEIQGSLKPALTQVLEGNYADSSNFRPESMLCSVT